MLRIFRRKKKPEKKPVGITFTGFVCKIGDKKYVYKPKRTNSPGKTPEQIDENEIMYNTYDDVFFVGTGDNNFKIYRAVE